MDLAFPDPLRENEFDICRIDPFPLGQRRARCASLFLIHHHQLYHHYDLHVTSVHPRDQPAYTHLALILSTLFIRPFPWLPLFFL